MEVLEVLGIDELVYAAVYSGAHTQDDVMAWLAGNGTEFDHDQVGSSLRGQAAQGKLNFTRKQMTYSFYDIPGGDND